MIKIWPTVEKYTYIVKSKQSIYKNLIKTNVKKYTNNQNKFSVQMFKFKGCLKEEKKSIYNLFANWHVLFLSGLTNL